MANSSKDSLALKYALEPNTLPDATGYHASVSHVETVDEDRFLGRVAARRPGLDAPTVKMVLDGICLTTAEYLSERQYRVALGDISFELAIPGSTDSIDGTMDGPAYVAVRVSSSLRNAAADVKPIYSAGDGERTEIFSIEDVAMHKRGEIRGVGAFRVAGVNLSASGEDESVKVVAADGTEAAAEVDEVTSTGRYVTAHLTMALPSGKGSVKMLTHGVRTPEGELRRLAKSVTIVAGATHEPTPAPDPIWESTDGLVKVMSVSDAETGSTFTWGDTWNATGEGFTGTEPGWFVELAMLKTAPTAELRQVGFDVKSATAIEITPEAGTEIEPGDYPDAVLQIGFARDSDDGLVTEAAEIPIHLVVR